jgi:Fe-Mn family superoxide dismutase
MSPTPDSAPDLSRRDALRLLGIAGAATVLPSVRAQSKPARGTPQPFVLAPLGYAFDALEPHIDARTMEIHHGRHHGVQVENANRILAGLPKLAGLSGEQIMSDLSVVPEEQRAGVRNNVGGHLNHALFWRLLQPGGGRTPGARLGAALVATFGSFEGFRAQFTDTAMRRFGSGWAWLVVRQGRLGIISTPNQDSPYSEAAVPILALDVWEHAYYLKYQNRRGDYVGAFWNVVNWDVAEREYLAALAA